MAVNPIALMGEISRRLMKVFKEINDLCCSATFESARIANHLQSQPTMVHRDHEIRQIKEPPKDGREKFLPAPHDKKREPQKGVPIINLEQVVQSAPSKNEKPPILQNKQKKTPKRQRSNRIKKGKSEQDPELPKKPAGSYLLFQKERKPHLQTTKPELSLTQLSKELGKEWQKLDIQTKNKYQNQYKQAKRKYQKEMQQYKKRHPEYVEPKRRKKASPHKQSEIEQDQVESSYIAVGGDEQDGLKYEDSLGQEM